MAELSQIIMAGLSMKQSALGQIQQQKNLDRARMDRVLKDFSVNIERSIVMNKKAKAEKEMGTLSLAIGAATASGRTADLPNIISKLGLETSEARTAAGQVMAGVPDAVEKARQRARLPTLEKKAEERNDQLIALGEQDIAAGTRRSAKDKLDLDIATANKRDRDFVRSIRDSRLEFSSFVNTMVSDGLTPSEQSAKLSEFATNNVEFGKLSVAQRSAIINGAGTQILTNAELSFNLRDSRMAGVVAKSLFDHQSKVGTLGKSPAEFSEEEAQAAAQAIFKDLESQGVGELTAPDLLSLISLSASGRFERAKVSAKQTAADLTRLSDAQKQRSVRRGKNDAGVAFNSMVGGALTVLAEGNVNILGLGGETFFADVIQEKFTKDMAAIESAIVVGELDEDYATAYADQFGKDQSEFLKSDGGLNLAKQIMRSGALPKVLESAQLFGGDFTSSDGTTYVRSGESDFSTWPQPVQDEFNRKTTTDYIRTLQEGSAIISATIFGGTQASGGGALFSNSSVALSQIADAVTRSQSSPSRVQGDLDGVRALLARSGVVPNLPDTPGASVSGMPKKIIESPPRGPASKEDLFGNPGFIDTMINNPVSRGAIDFIEDVKDVSRKVSGTLGRGLKPAPKKILDAFTGIPGEIGDLLDSQVQSRRDAKGLGLSDVQVEDEVDKLKDRLVDGSLTRKQFAEEVAKFPLVQIPKEVRVMLGLDANVRRPLIIGGGK